MDNTLPEPTEDAIIPESPPPFTGRNDVFIRIQQYLADPVDRHGLLIIGRKSIGKTQLLHQCSYLLEENIINCNLLVEPHTTKNESKWLSHWISQTHQTLEYHGFTVQRLPEVPEDTNEHRDWFIDVYLPEVNKLIRSHRRILWLMDDINVMIRAVEETRLPEDTFDYLYRVLESNPQSGIVMTLNEDMEAKAISLSPLVNDELLYRLHPLTPTETDNLIDKFELTVDEATKGYIYELTDGYPLILQFFGKALQDSKHTTISTTQVDDVLKTVYSQSHDHFRHIWQHSLSQNERLVLTAISGLLYDDPIRKLTTQSVESWLLETDYPLDMMAINASIRGLEYRDLVVGNIVDGIKIRGGLFQRWLIEFARMDEVNPVVAQSNAEGNRLTRNSILILVAAIIVLLALALSFQQGTQSAQSNPQPTVTLEQ